MNRLSAEEFSARYAAWIAKNKIEITSLSGMDVQRDQLHPRLREYQKDAVLWALRIGHGLIAAKFGLGKTTMQIEVLRQVHRVTGGAQMVICPLGVRQQFTHEDGPEMGIHFRYVRSDEEAQAALEAGNYYLITNYERVRDAGISEEWIAANVTGVTMDEAAILGNLGTKTLEQFRRIFDHVQYKWAATATPAPNDYKQMIYFGDFFDEMDQGQALTRFFYRNPDKAADLQIMPHMEREFWMWVSSWALFIERPSDIDAQYSDEGFDMPELEIVWHRLTSDHTKAWDLFDNTGQHFLLNDTKVGISKEGAEAWIAQSKGFTPKGNIEFIGDAMIADSYFRQYSVPSDAVGGRSEIRVWFKDDGQIVLDGIQFMPPESASRAVPSSPTP